MQNQLYKEIILDHWENPQNYGVIFNADIDLTENNPLCGDEIRLTITLSGNYISDIKFTTEGCAIAKASASLLTDKVKEMSIKNALSITPKKTLELLGVELTPTRTKCALLVYQTLQKALKTADNKIPLILDQKE